MYGRYYVLTLVWRGREYDITVFRSKLQKLQRPQAQKIADSIYPGSRVIKYHESDPTQGPVILATEEAPKGAKYDRMVKHIKKSYSKDGNLTKGEEGIAYATAWKHKNKNKSEGYKPKSKKKKPGKAGSEELATPSTDTGTASMGAFNSYGEETKKKCGKGEYFCNDEQKCKPIPKGHHVMPDGMLMKGETHKEQITSYNQLDKKKNCGCGQTPCITYGKKDLTKEGAAWTKKSGKNKEGGLNEKGRKSYERENPGSDLKAPSKKKGNKRRASFCARMKGMKKKLTSKKTARDPDSRINKSLRAWNC
jgi:hypothetical protein